MARYAVVYFRVVNKTYYEFINKGKYKPNIAIFSGYEPSILWCKKYADIGDGKISTIILSYTKEKDEYELDTQLINRAIKEAEIRVRKYQLTI